MTSTAHFTATKMGKPRPTFASDLCQITTLWSNSGKPSGGIRKGKLCPRRATMRVGSGRPFQFGFVCKSHVEEAEQTMRFSW